MKKPRITFRVESYVDPCPKMYRHWRHIQVTQREFLIFEDVLYRTAVFGTTAEEAQQKAEHYYAALNERYSDDPENNPLPIVNTTRE